MPPGQNINRCERICAVLCLLWFAPAGAQTLELGAQLSGYHYEEPGLMHIDGNRVGLTGVFSFEHDGLAHRFEGRASMGALRYEGSGVQDGVPDFLTDVRWLIGKRVASDLLAQPFAGLGYRYLFNDIRGTTFVGNQAYAGYRRYSNYIYLPLGISLGGSPWEGWTLTASAEYDRLLYGWQVSMLSDMGQGDPDVVNPQRTGYGYRGSLLLRNGEWSFGPWFQQWFIDDSDSRYIGGGLYVYEPANHTREVGLELRRRF